MATLIGLLTGVPAQGEPTSVYQSFNLVCIVIEDMLLPTIDATLLKR